MVKRIFLVCDDIQNLGLGDLVNRFSSIDPLKEPGVLLLPSNLYEKFRINHLDDTIYDLLKGKNYSIKWASPNRLSKHNLIKSGEFNPELKTKVVFSNFELNWAKNILNECNISNAKEVVAVCDNIPRKTKRKMWLKTHWINLIESILSQNPLVTIIFLPNFRDLSHKGENILTSYLIKKYPEAKIFSFQNWIKSNLHMITSSQKLFGKSRNHNGFSLRQYGAIVSELLRYENRFAVFNDSGPAHLTVASIGERNLAYKVISVNVEAPHYYALRNGGKSFSVKKGDKTTPKIVADYILSMR